MEPTTTLPDPVPVTLDDATVMTYALGPGPSDSAADVVLCHGTPFSALVWGEVAHHLGRDHRVLLWDMPGYGRSPKDPAVPVDLRSQMARFAQLLEHWDLDRPHVVAHDIGGAVALGAHLLHGRDYAALSLWDVVALEPWGSPFFRLVSDHTDVFTQLPPPLHAALVREHVAGAARHRLSAEWVERLSAPWLEPGGQAAFYRQTAALRPEHTHPLVERLHQVRCPVAIGWGEDDPWLPVAQADRLRALLPGEPAVTRLPEVGHLSPVEAAPQVRRALAEWVAP